MTLVDTSCWIEFFRPSGDSRVKAQVKELVLDGRAAFTCPVRYELILGARSHELEDLHVALGVSLRIPATSDHWDFASGLGAALRAKGLNFPALDLLIASVASVAQIPLLSNDRHFAAIRDQVLPDLVLA